MGQLFQNNQQLRKWNQLKTEFDLIERQKIFIFKSPMIGWSPEFMEINPAKLHRKYLWSCYLQSSFDKKVVKIFYLNKLNSFTLEEILVDVNKLKPSSQAYFEKLFLNYESDWKSMHLLPKRVIMDKNLRMFQYKLLSKVLHE